VGVTSANNKKSPGDLIYLLGSTIRLSERAISVARENEKKHRENRHLRATF